MGVVLGGGEERVVNVLVASSDCGLAGGQRYNTISFDFANTGSSLTSDF